MKTGSGRITLLPGSALARSMFVMSVPPQSMRASAPVVWSTPGTIGAASVHLNNVNAVARHGAVECCLILFSSSL